jgi:MFS family permease
MSDPAATARGKTSWLDMAVVLVSGVPATVAMSVLVPVLPRIEQALAHHSADTYLVKFVSSAVGLSMIVGAPLAGFLSDRLGRKPVLVAAFLLFAAAGMLGYALDDLMSLIASRLVVGVAGAGALTVGLSLIGDRFEGDMRSRLMGFNVTISTLSALAFIPLAGLVGESSWRNPFLLHAIGLPLALLALGLNAPRKAPAAPVQAAQAAPKTREPPPFGLMAFALIAGVITFAPVVYVPFRMRDLGVESPRIIALAVTANALTTGVSSALYGQARKKLSVDQAFMTSFALCGVAGLAMALAPSFQLLIASGLVFGLGMGWVAPNLMTAAAGAAGEARRGRVVGLVKGTHLVSSFLAVLLFEPISKAWGPGAVLAGVGSASVAMLAFCLARRLAPGRARPARAPL